MIYYVRELMTYYNKIAYYTRADEIRQIVELRLVYRPF